MELDYNIVCNINDINFYVGVFIKCFCMTVFFFNFKTFVCVCQYNVPTGSQLYGKCILDYDLQNCMCWCRLPTTKLFLIALLSC